MNEEKKRGESVLIEIKTRGGRLFFFFRALFYSKKKRRREQERVFFRPHFFFLSFDSFLFLFKHNNNKYNVVKQQREQKSIQYIRPTIDRSIDRYEMTQPHPGLFLLLSASSLNFSTIGSR